MLVNPSVSGNFGIRYGLLSTSACMNNSLFINQLWFNLMAFGTDLFFRLCFPVSGLACQMLLKFGYLSSTLACDCSGYALAITDSSGQRKDDARMRAEEPTVESTNDMSFPAPTGDVGDGACANDDAPPTPVPFPIWEPYSDETHPDHDDVEDAMREGSTDCYRLAVAIDTLVRDLRFRRWDMQYHGGGDTGHRKAYYIRREALQQLVETARTLGCPYNPEADLDTHRPHNFSTPRY